MANMILVIFAIRFLENGIKVTKVDIRSDDRGKVTTGEKENTFENAEAD